MNENDIRTESGAPAFAPQPGQLVRICTCGAVSPASARRCLACGGDIADLMPTPYEGEPTAAPGAQEPAPESAFGGALLRLTSVDGLCTLDVTDSCALGRAAELAAYLADKPYVSRRQAFLTVDDGRVYIVHCGGCNPTCLNNSPLHEGAPVELHEGDEIALGGMTIDGQRQPMAAYFRVSAAEARE